MKVRRIICPACEFEKKVILDKDNLHGYSEEVVSEVCDREECQRWHNSPEQRLLRAMFGQKEVSK